MAFYDDYYQHQQHHPDYHRDDASHSFSYDFSASYSNNSQHRSFVDQLFGYGYQTDDIENALPHAASSYPYTGFSSNLHPAISFNDNDRCFSGYGYSHPSAYDHQHHNSHYSYTSFQPVISYSASPFYESKTFRLDPNRINPDDPCVTRFVVSYSTVEFNEPDFEEYDPTPYGGGYDLSSTYGKPLPPSNNICYPKDTTKDDATNKQLVPIAIPEVPTAVPEVPMTVPEEIPSSGKTSDPKDTIKDNTQLVPIPVIVPAVIPTTGPGKEADPREKQPTLEHEEPKPLMLVPGDRTYPPQHPEVTGNGNDRIYLPAPPGMGLDTLDLCESLFGYWPCLARDTRRAATRCPHGYVHGGKCIHRMNEWEWEGAANYLFGSPNPYHPGISSNASSRSVFPYPYEEDEEAQYRQLHYDPYQ